MGEDKLRGPIITLGAVQLVESLAVALPLSFFPNYVVELGASVASIGLFTSSFMIAFAVLSPKMGSLSDKYGRKRLMMFGVASDVVLGVLTGLVPSWEWLLAIRMLNGAVSSAAMLASETLLIDLVDPRRRGEASGFIMSMNMVGRNLGPMLGGGIQWLAVGSGFSVLMSYRIPYFVDSFFALVALVMVWLLIREPEQRSAPRRGVGAKEAPRVVFTTPLKLLMVNSFVSGIGVGFIIPIMVLFYTDRFGMSPVGIGTIITVSGFIGLLASYVAGRFSDKVGRKPLIGLGNYVSRTAGGLLPFTQSITQAGVVVSFRSLGFNVSMPAFRALRADLVAPEVRGRMFGLFGTAFTAGSVIGPIIGTWIYSTYRFTTFNVLGLDVPGYGIPFIIESVLGLLSTTMIMLLIEEPSDEEKAPQFSVARSDG
ncbi:MAG TPA: MFS transporter [Candidatus Krumholzibacteriaceae bacterium]|nr:MFS transporter [Candidatus Krumholzibacteriaceae bacterium]